MILADTSVWIDHLKAGDETLATLLSENNILCHPYVVAELSLGSLNQRAEILALLDNIPRATMATMNEIRHLVETRHLYSRGIGYVDTSLVASCLLSPGTRLWTRDKRLRSVADELMLSHDPARH